jgi:hypothetical protein
MKAPEREIPPRTAPFWAALAACALLASWIANSAAILDDSHYRNAWHHYEYLAEGFLHGHTYLSVAPEPGLLKLKDPYDPESNAHYRLWDATLFGGKYYLYFGPTPALVMLPWRIVTGHPFPQRLAVAAFAAAGLAALALLLLGVRKRHFPSLSAVALGGILVVAFHASWLPVTLRRPAVWELPIVAAVACLWWAIFFLWKFHDSGGGARWAVAGGTAIVLLMGSRVTFVFAAGAITLLFLTPGFGIGPKGTRSWNGALIVAALAFAGGVALLFYNHERFGKWLEFGQTFQLWGGDERQVQHFSVRYLPYNAWVYLLSMPEFGPYFPFLHPFWSADRPVGHLGTDEIYGVLFMMPIHLAGFAACGWAWRNRAVRGSRATRAALAAAICATVLAGLIVFCWVGACSRYTTELLAGWTVATSVGLMAVFAPGERPRPGRALRILAVAAACWSLACVWLASAESRGYMARENPQIYSALAHVLDYPSLWWARVRGNHFGPVEMTVRIPPFSGATTTVLVASGRPQMENRLFISRVDAGHVRLSLLENDHSVLESPEIALTGDRLDVRLDAPWLYPPPAHPYWEGLDAGVARERQTFFSIDWRSGVAREHSTRSVDPVGLDPVVASRSVVAPGEPYVESVRPAPSR